MQIDIPGTKDALQTRRAEAGLYLVDRVSLTGAVLASAIYKIERAEYGGGWELSIPHADGWTQVGGNRDTLKSVLHAAAARAEHDRLWADYQVRHAAWEKARNEPEANDGLPRLHFEPKPETHKIDTETGKLWGTEIKMQADRMGREGHLPTYRVFMDDTEIGFIYLMDTRWHVGGAGDWCAGPNHDWTTFRHGGGERDPKIAAAHFARGVMRIVIHRYTAHAVNRRDEQVARERAEAEQRRQG